MTSFHQFRGFAASRGEGLHPKLRALLDGAASSPFSEVSLRHDGLIQAGPDPESEECGRASTWSSSFDSPPNQ
jgi:hypothetical protein